MHPYKTTLERAFELARSRDFATVTDIRSRLKTERYDLDQMLGRQLNAQLRDIIAQASKG
jgi:hypothetical protein